MKKLLLVFGILLYAACSKEDIVEQTFITPTKQVVEPSTPAPTTPLLDLIKDKYWKATIQNSSYYRDGFILTDDDFFFVDLNDEEGCWRVYDRTSASNETASIEILSNTTTSLIVSYTFLFGTNTDGTNSWHSETFEINNDGENITAFGTQKIAIEEHTPDCLTIFSEIYPEQVATLEQVEEEEVVVEEENNESFAIQDYGAQPLEATVYQFAFNYKTYRYSQGSDNVYIEVTSPNYTNGLPANYSGNSSNGNPLDIEEGTIFYAFESKNGYGRVVRNQITTNDLIFYNSFQLLGNSPSSGISALPFYNHMVLHKAIKQDGKLIPTGESITILRYMEKWEVHEGNLLISTDGVESGIEIAKNEFNNLVFNVPANFKPVRFKSTGGNYDSLGDIIYNQGGDPLSPVIFGLTVDREYRMPFDTFCNGHCPAGYKIEAEVYRGNGNWEVVQTFYLDNN